MIVTIDDTDLSDVTRNVLIRLKEKYGINARPSGFLEMIKFAFGIEGWLMLDERYMANGSFDSYLIDKLVDFRDHKPVDLDEVYKALLVAGDFAQSEKRRFELGGVKDIIRAIFLAITNKY